nr:hypothetical protein [uncultured Chryseobacterium sp.]
MNHRNNIVEYIICVPRSLASVKTSKGKKTATKTEENRIDELAKKIGKDFPNTTFTWWFEQDMQNQLLELDNEGMNKFWFERDIITHNQLVQQFEMEKAAWIDKRYIPELHGPGIIQQHIEEILYSQPYRKNLLRRIERATRTLQNTTSLITAFNGTLEESNIMLPELFSIQANINHNLAALFPIVTAIQEGVNQFPLVNFHLMPVSNDLFIALDKLQPSALQLGIYKRLYNSLNRIVDLDLQGIIDQIRSELDQSGRLFLGEGGTGKTHAFSNTVDVRLNQQELPALIIRAKGAPVDDWTLLLKKALDIDNWNKNEMLSALETLAVRADHQSASTLNPGEELKNEPAKIIICVDGLEEDTEHWPEWYERIRECVTLKNRYSRVRFAFTARPYFLDAAEMPTAGNFRIIDIPREGDLPVQQLIDRYFNHFSISVQPKSLIRGMDTLYALRLFCKLYEGQKLTADDAILIAEHDLLHEKINRMDDEFKQVKSPGGARTPVRDAIEVIADVFYSKALITHQELYAFLKDGALHYLDNGEIERAIEFLVNNAFLTKSEIPVGKGAIRKKQINYTLTYQSTMEIIMAEKYVERIINKEIAAIPEHLRPVLEVAEKSEQMLINQRIVQEIVNMLFHNHNLMIGRDNFLADGISKATIQQLQTKALIQAPPEIAATFEHSIKNLYFKDYKSRYIVFRELIYPSAASSTNYFGAEYLHKILMKQPTAVDRDKIWLGMDSQDIHELGKEESLQYHLYDLRRVIDPRGEGELYLSELSLHNKIH